MGVILSVLVACVGVIELIDLLYNVRRHLVWPPVRADLTPIDNSLRRIACDLENLASSGVPTLRLNSHEDIELEYDEDIGRSRSSSPRKFLVTEKEVDRESPRRFVVSEEPGLIKKSKSQDSIPEFLIREEKNREKSPNKPRYVLREQQGGTPIPLPRQFIVTEDGLSSVVFEDSDFEVAPQRCSSPYPPTELPQLPRNGVCEVADIEEEDEELCRSISPLPSEKIDVILRSTGHNTTEFWTNKVLVQPPGAGRSKSTVRSKSEGPAEPLVDEQYLNSLDGVNKVKRQKGFRRSFKKKHSSDDGGTKHQDSCEDSVDKSEDLREVSSDKSLVERGEGAQQKAGEPFWVKE